ncbi:MAG: polysaccharide biosynthesis tyrosine autokinase [Paludibacteraceae bacterium]|nr:polysaccharide biosynthesis tyrosine autokinase [Paludibacteraceae bacterium]
MSQNTSQNTTNEVDVRKIFHVALEHWWWFVIGVVICLLLGVAYYMRKTPTWTTDASIMLRQSEGAGSGFDAMSLLGIAGNQAAEDEVVVLSSRGLLYQSIDALNLWEEYSVKNGLRWQGEFRNPAFTVDYINLNEDGQLFPFSVTVNPRKNGYKVRVKMGWRSSSYRVQTLDEPLETRVGTIRIHAKRPLSTDTTYRVKHKRRELVVDAYRRHIKIAQYKKESNVITLTTTSTMPDRDRALLTQMIEQYNLNAVVDKNMIATNTAAFIDERLAIISEELGDAEEAVSEYKQKNNIADLNAQAKLFLEASSQEQIAMVEVETQISLVNYVDEFLRDDTKRNNLIPANIGIEDEALTASISEYNTIVLQRMRILRTATEDNPVVDQMNAQLGTMRENIIATIASVRESLQIRQKSLKAQDSKYNRQIKDAPDQQREYVRVVRQQQIKERLYVFLYEKREENALMLAATVMPAKILDVPQKDLESQSPDLKKILILCFLLGLLLPAGCLYLFILFNDKITDPKEFEKQIKAPLLGQLVENSRKAHIAIHEGESTVSAELFRLIRTNLRFFLSPKIQSPVILVTSCINGDGKSYVSSNTALSLAILGKKVVLVGLDIRKPMLATYFHLSTKGHLTDYLAEADLTVDDIIVPSGEHKKLDLIPCGTVPPNPAELLQTQRLDELFAELRKRYDYIIVDTAPVALVSDTYLLDRVADMTIFVCRYKYTPTEMIDYINQVIEQNRMHNIACVLNGVKSVNAGYGYGYTKKD